MIWIDVSDLLVWKGHLTGIQRVVFNIASRYQIEYPDNVRYFAYEHRQRCFYQVDIDLMVWFKSQELIPKESNQSSADKVKRLLINPSTTKYIPRSAKSIAKKSLKIGMIQANNLRNYISEKAVKKSKLEKISFTSKDTVIVLGNAWDRCKLFEDLSNKKDKEKFKLVNIVYDLIPVLYPHFFGGLLINKYADYLFEAILCCDLMLPISVSTEKDLLEFCRMIDLPEPKTKVIRLGDEVNNVIIKEPSWYRGEKFILCVGTLEVRKNPTLLYYAYKNLIDAGAELPELVMVGSRGWYTDDIMMLFRQDPQLSDKVRILENTHDDELAWLYNNCLVNVYPSMYEGWGLPIAESLARGKVTIASNAASMPEVGGDCVDYFSPYDPVMLAEIINKYMISKDLVLKRQAEIVKKFKPTTWDACYSQCRDLIASI